MQSITLEKNTLSIKYADKFFRTTFNENTFKDCRIISNENIVDMINDATYTTYTYDAIMESLTLVINFVEKTRFITITDKCEILLTLETNNEQLFVRDKISSLEQQIAQLKLDNERLRNELYSDDYRMIRYKQISENGCDFFKNYYNSKPLCSYDVPQFIITIDEYKHFIKISTDEIKSEIIKKYESSYSFKPFIVLKFNNIEHSYTELGMYDIYQSLYDKLDEDGLKRLDTREMVIRNQYIKGPIMPYITGFIKYKDQLLYVKYSKNGGHISTHFGQIYENPIIIMICEIVE
jgi:hypothetical protein